MHPSSLSDPQDTLTHLMRQFWQLQPLGITTNEPSVMDLFQQQIRYDGNRYTVRLPWREHHYTQSDTHRLCIQHLQSTLRRLRRTPELLNEYDKVIQDQISRGIVEEVPVVQDDPAAVIHYLPHHHVVWQDKTTAKVRVAYDASARVQPHPSLNDCLHAGPPLLEQITDILLRFRSHTVAFTADIEKAFLIVGIHDSDRAVLRFLGLRILSPTLLRSIGIASPELCLVYDQAHSCLMQPSAIICHSVSQNPLRNPRKVSMWTMLHMVDPVTMCSASFQEGQDKPHKRRIQPPKILIEFSTLGSNHQPRHDIALSSDCL